jgi:hypothetical protein
VILVADNFLAGALITLLIPASVFVAITIWYTRTVIRRERDRELEEPGTAATPATAPEGGTSRATP